MRYFLEIVITVLVMAISLEAQKQGDLCVVAETIQPGVCRHFLDCPGALEAAFQGKPPQVCVSPENKLVVCCPWVPGQETGLEASCQANTTTPREGDNCTMVGTGRVGVCSRFADCRTAIEAASKGDFPQICDFAGTIEIVCCPMSTVVEGDKCTMVDTGRTGICKPFANCQTAKEAAYKGIFPQICDVAGTIEIVCCPMSTVVEGDNCTMVDTGRTGICKPFANCQTAKEAAYKGIFPQTCDVEGSNQIVCCPLETFVEGDNCTMVDTGSAGVCRPFANCQAAKEAASRGIFQQKCDLTDNESMLVCCTKTNCPPLPKGLVTQLPIGSKAADYCIELAEKIHPCQETGSGWTRGDMCPLLTPDSNIVYHKTPMTTAAEAPYFTNEDIVLCSQGRIGSGQRGAIDWKDRPVNLVSERWVLCSAYSIEIVGSSDVKFVGLGGTFTPLYNPDEIYGVKTQHIHPLYNRSYSVVYNDIALIQLDREVKFTSRILPACLHTGTPLPNSGFIFTARDSSTDYKTSIQRVSQEECSKVFSVSDSDHPAGIKHDVEICSRPDNATVGCLGWFRGSSLTLPNNLRVTCTHLLVGLVSGYTSSPCTFSNTRISGFIPWMEGIVWPESGFVV